MVNHPEWLANICVALMIVKALLVHVCTDMVLILLHFAHVNEVLSFIWMQVGRMLQTTLAEGNRQKCGYAAVADIATGVLSDSAL